MLKNNYVVIMSLLCLIHVSFASEKRAIIIGSSSGMGRAVTKLLSSDGYVVGIAARRLPLLEVLQKELVGPSFIKQMDVAQPQEAVKALKELIEEMGGLDLLIITVTGFRESSSKAVFDTDILGFYALADVGFTFFESQQHGHFVGFSSIDGLRGIAFAPEYSAAKSFCSRYMEAKRNYFMQKKIPITVTDIMPGWINSLEDPNFLEKYPHAYWVDSLGDASQDIMEAIQNKLSVAYITKRWKQVADILKIMPDELYNALGGL